MVAEDCLDRFGLHSIVQGGCRAVGEEALKLFSESGRILTGDMPSILYIDRCKELILHPPAEDWDGVYTAKTK